MLVTHKTKGSVRNETVTAKRVEFMVTARQSEKQIKQTNKKQVTVDQDGPFKR